MRIITGIIQALSNQCCRLRLHNDSFTIITNTCIGGIMYHKLGKRFLSPTINLWFQDEDFFKMVNDFDYYFAQPLRFVKIGMDYPTAYLDDILIHFNHYHTEDEAAAKWSERVKRINKDNLFLICSDRPDKRSITYDDIASLKSIPCRGKVVFSVNQYKDIDYIVPLPKDDKGNYVNQYMFDKSKLAQRYRWEFAWDWVHWLNTGEVNCKK